MNRKSEVSLLMLWAALKVLPVALRSKEETKET